MEVLNCLIFVPLQTRGSFCGLHLYLLLQKCTPVFSPTAIILKSLDHAFTLSRKTACKFSLSSLTIRAVGNKVCCRMELARCSFPRCLKVAIDLRIAAEGRNSWVCIAPIPWHNGFWGRKCYYNLYPQPLGC